MPMSKTGLIERGKERRPGGLTLNRVLGVL
jgi:hypothetical protein